MGDVECGTTRPKKEIAQTLVNYALLEVERKHGKGQGDGENPKSYHNRVHAQDVLDASRQITKRSLTAGKVETSDIPLVEIAAAFHDIEQDMDGGLNETESARLAEIEMRKNGIFNEEDIQKVRRMILATIIHFDDGIMKQSATEEFLTQVIADADLSHLGREPNIYWSRAMGLLKEIKGTNDLSKEDTITFAEGQPTFLTNHQFYTEEARRLFAHKQENITFARTQIELLKN